MGRVEGGGGKWTNLLTNPIFQHMKIHQCKNHINRMKEKNHIGNPLEVQCVGLCFHCRGHRFNPWSGNRHPTSITVWGGKKIFFFSTETGKAWDKIQYPFMIEPLNKPVIEGNYFNLIKAIYRKLIVNTILKWQK